LLNLGNARSMSDLMNVFVASELIGKESLLNQRNKRYYSK